MIPRAASVGTAWLVAALVLAAGAGVFVALDRPDPIDYYRLVGDRTIVVGSITGRGAWTRVSSVTETPTSVVVAVRSFDIPFVPRAEGGLPIEYVVTLDSPLGDRTVLDASTGGAVPEAKCLGPTPFAGAPCR
jgi:hypothetical protein